MADQDTRVQERGVTDTSGRTLAQAEGSGTYVEAKTVFNSAFDNKKTKIKSIRNWYPDIDGNDVTKSYTTGF